MSYGSYDNSSPLSQPFNPTGPSAGQDIVDSAVRSGIGAAGQQYGNSKSSGQFGNGKSHPGDLGPMFRAMAQGGQPLTLGGGPQMRMPGGTAQDFEGGDLPGAPPQSAQPPLTPQQRVDQSQQSGGILKMRGQQPGQPAQMPGGKGGKSGPDVNDRVANPMPGILQPDNMPGIAYDSNIGSAFGPGFFSGSLIPVDQYGNTGQGNLMKAQNDFLRGQ